MSDQTRSATGLLSDALAQMSTLVRSEVDLARTELNENVGRAGAALGLLAGAALAAITALNVLAAAIVAGLANAGLAAGWAALIVGVAFAVAAYAMMSKGTNDLKATSLAPTRTAKNVGRDARALKDATDAR